MFINDIKDNFHAFENKIKMRILLALLGMDIQKIVQYKDGLLNRKLSIPPWILTNTINIYSFTSNSRTLAQG